MKPFNLCSYFNPPISNTVPVDAVDIGQLHWIITSDKNTKYATDFVRSKLGDKKEFNKAKTQRLAFVTPAGVFRQRNEQGLLVPSRMFIVDVDKLKSPEEAIQIRDMVFADSRLNVALAFVSPSGLGVKFFIPFAVDYSRPFRESYQEAIHGAWNYLQAVHDIEADRANIDVARCCFVSHDGNARIRTFQV